MHIRRTQERDLPAIAQIFALGIERQHREGNYSQWRADYPTVNDVTQDIQHGTGWVCVADDDHTVLGTWALGTYEAVYDQLKSGRWSVNRPYHVIHRLGTMPGHGAGTFIMRYLQAHYDYLRVDTFEQNASMIALLKKTGFTPCGVAYYEGFGDMLTFDYLRPAHQPNP
ncbi:MAG TPA: hypothetical protein H9898_10235 [Candidatus Anaerobiospirillum stercoravium]|nr:hypothetical protein [Candidatus Anaerobiospirillum stercoravium]